MNLPRMAVVPCRSEFACELVAQECTGRTFLGEDVRGSTQKRRFCFAKTRVQKCTWMYTSGQSISKDLRRSSVLFSVSRVNASDRVDKKRRIIEAVRPFEPRSGSILVEQTQ